ncbi:MAG TPA: arylsulfatase [Chloroflexota bacterium]|jgi:arylsulfatase
MAKAFKGIINLDARDSTPDWEPYLPPKAADDSPNVLFVCIDDTGIAAWDTFGGLIEMPTLGRIAQGGLRFTNWHTTALCSPTRSCFMTGRNAHMNNMAVITEAANGFPGASALIPFENGFISEMLLEAGYTTFGIGKWHLTPETELTLGSTRRTWPTGRGFERYYGFLGGETNNWFPDLVYDNHTVDPPATPEEGYHLSKDLADKAIEFVRDLKQVNPEKPWFMYWCPGANHAPHHGPKEWADKYKGKFDMGYEKYREETLARMKKLGVVPENTELSGINPWPAPDVIGEGDTVRPWDSLSDDEKRLFARMAEVYAGFSSYTDNQLGRVIDYLEESGQLENTIVIVCSDNGASGEGGPDGSVNENKFFNNWPDDIKENLAKIDELGGPGTYNHYPTGWAVAFNTPYKMFKRYTLEGGIADPLIISWPKAMKAVAGQTRDQYCHAIDLVPTILDCCGVEAPEVLKGYTQSPIQGTSLRYAFADAKAPAQRETQYYAMLGTRAIYHQGWKAVARHGALLGKGKFMDDEWELYHVEDDRTETRNLAAQHPDKLKELIGIWFAVAGANHVFPLDDRSARELLNVERPETSKPRTSYDYYPGTADVPEAVAPNIRNRSYTILAEVEIATPEAAGVLMAQGARFGGHALFVKDGKLHYSYNFLGMEEQHVVSTEAVPTGKVVLGAEFTKDGENPPAVANGTLKLFINDKAVGDMKMRTQPGKFSLAGEGLCVGRDSADAVSKEYTTPYTFTGGTIQKVTINVNGDHYVDLEIEALAMLSRE